MILSHSYSRVAVRPFPLTDEMRRIIQESVDEVRQLIRDKIEGRHNTESLYTLWDGIASSPVGDFHLIVEANLDLFVDGPKGYTNVDKKEKEAKVHLDVRFGSLFDEDVYEYYLENPTFLTSFSQLLHHELVHAFDIKNWSTEIHRRLPEYPDFYKTGEFDKYIKHPVEVSAYGAESYYYFKNKKEEGVPLSEAIRSYLSERHTGASEAYREVTRRGDPKSWKEFLTRIYKSAEQAYQDVAQESKTGP